MELQLTTPYWTTFPHTLHLLTSVLLLLNISSAVQGRYGQFPGGFGEGLPNSFFQNPLQNSFFGNNQNPFENSFFGKNAQNDGPEGVDKWNQQHPYGQRPFSSKNPQNTFGLGGQQPPFNPLFNNFFGQNQPGQGHYTNGLNPGGIPIGHPTQITGNDKDYQKKPFNQPYPAQQQGFGSYPRPGYSGQIPVQTEPTNQFPYWQNPILNNGKTQRPLFQGQGGLNEGQNLGELDFFPGFNHKQPSTPITLDPSAPNPQLSTANQIQPSPANQIQPPTTNQISYPNANQIQLPTSNQIQPSPANQIQPPTTNQISYPNANQIQLPTSNQIQPSPANQIQLPTSNQIQLPTSNQISPPTAIKNHHPIANQIPSAPTNQNAPTVIDQIPPQTANQILSTPTNQVSPTTTNQIPFEKPPPTYNNQLPIDFSEQSQQIPTNVPENSNSGTQPYPIPTQNLPPTSQSPNPVPSVVKPSSNDKVSATNVSNPSIPIISSPSSTQAPKQETYVDYYDDDELLASLSSASPSDVDKSGQEENPNPSQTTNQKLPLEIDFRQNIPHQF